jgi:hypothetical protein
MGEGYAAIQRGGRAVIVLALLPPKGKHSNM